jgi:hypothetical protein
MTLFMVLSNFAKAFRALFRRASVESFQNLDYEPPPEEPLARYLFHASQFTSERVKARAFEPPVDLRLSVFRTRELSEPRRWELGRRFATSVKNKTLRGRADLSVSAVSRFSLRTLRDEPPPRHAVVTGWPDTKDARMSVAQQLAAESALVIAPPLLTSEGVL